jgi:putative holliday junction resolvase
MATILGLDVGDKRIGIALGESEVKIAFPQGAVERTQGHGEREILQIIAERGVKLLVVGVPLGIDGDETPQSRKVRKFCSRLQKRASVEIRFVDEYLSSEAAKEKLGFTAPARHDKRPKGDVDAAAAALILQNFFDSGSL